jgi:hypothetical protein
MLRKGSSKERAKRMTPLQIPDGKFGIISRRRSRYPSRAAAFLLFQNKHIIMAIHLTASYSKKIGLPGYSSAQYSLTVETEVSDLSHIETQSRELHERLQENVDRELQSNPGFVPDATYGKDTRNPRQSPRHNPIGNGSDEWSCSEKQRDLILKLMTDHGLDKQTIEEKSKLWHALPVKALNRLQASAFIADLIDVYGKNGPKRGVRPVNGSRRPA